MLGSEQVTKATWYHNGGFANPRCWRRFRRGWVYYFRHD